jgi:hypothetical protein
MKKLLLLSVLILVLPSCERGNFEADSYLVARIVGFDLNCSTCTLEFPDDSLNVRKEIGKSPENKYQSVNLNRGNYQTGQLLKVKIRKPDTDELAPCIDLYPSYNYKSVFVSEYEDFDNLVLNDTITLSTNDCLNDVGNHFYICLESVPNDSRCPTGVYCFWEGNATARFRYQSYNSNPVIFSLNTHKAFGSDTIIDKLKFTLIGLTPYPNAQHLIKPTDYTAKILIDKI